MRERERERKEGGQAKRRRERARGKEKNEGNRKREEAQKTVIRKGTNRGDAREGGRWSAGARGRNHGEATLPRTHAGPLFVKHCIVTG